MPTQIIIIKVQASTDCTARQAIPDFSLLLLLIAMTTPGTIIQLLLKKNPTKQAVVQQKVFQSTSSILVPSKRKVRKTEFVLPESFNIKILLRSSSLQVPWEKKKSREKKIEKKAYSEMTGLALDVHKSTHLKNTKCAASKPKC